MNSKSFLILAVLAVHSASALKCNVCFSSKSKRPACEVLSCDSLDDVKNAYSSLAFQQTGLEVDKDALELIGDAKKAHQFVCARSVVKYHGSKHKTVTSTCTVDNPDFKPSDKPYNAKEYHMHGIDEKEANTEVQKYFLDKIKTLEGDVYVCNDKVGEGKNCGEKSSSRPDDGGLLGGLLGSSGRGRHGGHGRGRGREHGLLGRAHGLGLLERRHHGRGDKGADGKD